MRLDKLVAATHGPDAARSYRSYALSLPDRDSVGEIGKEVMRYFAPLAGACTGLSAVYAEALHGVAGLPAYVVAGTLAADGRQVFGSGKPIDGKVAFCKSDPSWDGHVWVAIGDYIADISIGWTAKLFGPRALAAVVSREMGPHAGLLIVKSRTAPEMGLSYSPQYVLTTDQVAVLAESARNVFEKA